MKVLNGMELLHDPIKMIGFYQNVGVIGYYWTGMFAVSGCFMLFQSVS
jgi:hypothetical protein